jgi:ABC-type transport system substrate-binding protein
MLMSESSFGENIDLRVNPDNTNYFKVAWENSIFPNSLNSCGNGACRSMYRACLCDINVLDRVVFTTIPSENSIIKQLHIGAVDPQLLDSYSQVPNTGSVKVWHKNGGYDEETIFSINYQGRQTYLKNMISTVQISGSEQFEFRNPPTFLNLGFREKRDAMYETDAALENYFHHDNVAPFLALRLIQRFGISNPSPRYVEAVARGTFVTYLLHDP